MRSTYTNSYFFALLSSLVFINACGTEMGAFSVSPSRFYDDQPHQIYIYGQGFKDDAVVSVNAFDEAGGIVDIPLEDIKVLDENTIRATIPSLHGKIAHTIYPYKEFVSANEFGFATVGLYDCSSREPVIWTKGSSQGYCDENGNKLSYRFDEFGVVIPPGSGDNGSLEYSSWYSNLSTCSNNFDTEVSTLEEGDLNLLIPNYGLGCFYPESSIDFLGMPEYYTYCPLINPATEVKIVVSQKDSSSEILSAITVLDWSYDYYRNPLYLREKGFFSQTKILSSDIIPIETQLADLNLDGYLDLISIEQEFNLLSINMGPLFELSSSQSDSSVAYPIDIYSLYGDLNPLSFVYGDINNDLYPDIIVSSVVENSEDPKGQLVIFLSDSTSMSNGGTLVYLDPIYKTLSISNPANIAIGDLNADSLLDVVVVDESSDSGVYSKAEVLLQSTGSVATFTSAKVIDLLYKARSVAIADFNSDSYLDIITVGGGGIGKIKVQLTTSGSSSEWSSSAHDTTIDGYELNSIAYGISKSTSLDFTSINFDLPHLFDLRKSQGEADNSSYLDIAVSATKTSNASSGVMLFTGDGTGKFITTPSSTDSPIFFLLDIGANNKYPQAISLVDVNGDSNIDIISSYLNSDQKSSHITAYFGSDGGFSSSSSNKSWDIDDKITSICAQDIDIDGDRDGDNGIDYEDQDIVIVGSNINLWSNSMTINQYFRDYLQECSY